MRERGRGQILYQQSQSKTGSKDVDNGASKRVLWCEERKKKSYVRLFSIVSLFVSRKSLKASVKLCSTIPPLQI